jgi:copper(I)-binding protein
MKFKTLTRCAALAVSLLTTAMAQTVDVKNAWVRTSVPGQKATGAFMTLTAKDGAKLVNVSSPVAGVVELELKLPVAAAAPGGMMPSQGMDHGGHKP